MNNVLRLIKYHTLWVWDYFFYKKPNLKEQNDKSITFRSELAIGTIVANKWGEFKHTYQQNLFKYGWEFVTPKKNHGVLGYPSIKSFIEPTTDLKAIINFDFSLNLNFKKYNLSVDLWLLNKPVWNLPDVHTEVMIWEDYNISRPAGKVVDRIVIGGETYKVFKGWADKRKENLGTDGWEIITFVNVNRRRKGTIYLKEFLRYVNKVYYTERIEMGTEVYNADGQVFINHYEITNI